jgi:hypothetical protein
VTPSARGWLPTAIGLDPQSRRAVVRWLEFGSAKLAEPFFDQTVERLRRAEPPANEAQSGLDTLLKLGEGLAPVTPAGFIFHVSRCGSTLIANALKTADRTVVVSEAPPPSILFHPDAGSFVPRVGASWDEIRRALFGTLISLFAHYRTGEPSRVVIKFPSWNILHWSVVRSYWPDVPCVVVIRDPVEVITAQIGGGGWMDFKKSPELACRLFGWKNLPRSVAEMSKEEYAARVLGGYYTCAREMGNERCRVLDHQDVGTEPIRAIAAFFGLELPASAGELDRILGVYSKDPSGAQPFQPDGLRKQRLATGLVRSAAYQWATPVYSDLKKRCSC